MSHSDLSPLTEHVDRDPTVRAALDVIDRRERRKNFIIVLLAFFIVISLIGQYRIGVLAEENHENLDLVRKATSPETQARANAATGQLVVSINCTTLGSAQVILDALGAGVAILSSDCPALPTTSVPPK